VQSLISSARLIAERTKDGIAAAHVRGKRSGRKPLDADRIGAALKLIAAGLSPTAAAHQIGLGRSTVYREVRRGRHSQPVTATFQQYYDNKTLDALIWLKGCFAFGSARGCTGFDHGDDASAGEIFL
jgi:hypothetical protein